MIDEINLLYDNGQEHLEGVLKKGGALQYQLQSLDWSELRNAIDQCISSQSLSELSDNYEPANFFPLQPQNDGQSKLYKKAFILGEEIISSGKMAAFTVAGGQGTRLGFDGPKGTFPVSPVMKKSLFQIFAEQLLGIREKYKVSVPWYIMCSPLNYEATAQFFYENDFFGLSLSDVKFITQGVMPVTDFEGKLLAKDKDNLALSPNGHGGSFKALIDSGSIADMKNRGIDYISYFQVDNPLISIADPLFIGLHVLEKSEMSSRSLTKTGPHEKLGNFVKSDGKVFIIEYSDLPKEKAEELDEAGNLKYRAGSPAIHLMSREFIEKFADSSLKLPYHRAEKKVSYIDENGQKHEPEVPNAVKFETFVFDALPLAKNPIILEADRVNDFAPVKNKEGVDSLESSQKAQIDKAISWLRKSGIRVSNIVIVEISPKYLSPEDLNVEGPFIAGVEYYIR